jgi:hypothetical protein
VRRPLATRLKATALSIVALLLLPLCGAMAADCPPDGDEGLLPTFDAGDQCGNYDDCTALAQDNQVEAARACSKKIDDCAAAVRESNAKADAHNAALEACRASMPSREKSKSSSGGNMPAVSNP